MRLKMLALTSSAIILWVAPLYALDKKIAWHRAIQGASLLTAFGCAIESSRTAKKLAAQEAFENAKRAMIIADLQDELAQSAYLSEQERRLQNQNYLQSIITPPTTPATPALDKAFTASHQVSHPIPEGWEFPDPRLSLTGVARGVIVACLRCGWGQGKTIEAVFGISKGGNNPSYDAAKYWYQTIKAEVGGEGE